MSDLIERDKVIEYCLKLIDVERKQGSDVMNYGQERINQTDAIIAFVENLPSARPQGEWASVLAKLHDRFDALEKELRKASAEMSAIIREYVDGLKDEPQTKEPKTILEELLERQTKEDIRNMKERLRKAVEDEQSGKE